MCKTDSSSTRLASGTNLPRMVREAGLTLGGSYDLSRDLNQTKTTPMITHMGSREVDYGLKMVTGPIPGL